MSSRLLALQKSVFILNNLGWVTKMVDGDIIYQAYLSFLNLYAYLRKGKKGSSGRMLFTNSRRLVNSLNCDI